VGVHIYSGSLIRFYTNDWENEIQRWARENGVEYQSTFSGPTPTWPTSEQTREHLAWMRGVLEEQVGADHVSWNDDTVEYHTIKLHEDGRDAITLVAAHLHRPDLPMPHRMPPDLMSDAAYAEAGKKGYLVGPIAAFDSSLILPGDFEGVRLIESPLNEKVLICSTEFLRTALSYVAENYWRGHVEPFAWADRGLIYARGSGATELKGGESRFVQDDEPNESLRGNAEFAFGVYSSLLAFSDEHRTAIAIW
jgi:hypothetical protein